MGAKRSSRWVRASGATFEVLATFTSFATFAVARAEGLPRPLGGLWETTTEVNGQSRSIRHCVGDTVDPFLLKFGQSLAGAFCPKLVVTKTADGYRSESTCKLGTVSIEATTVVTGDLSSSFKIERTSVSTGMPGKAGPVSRTTSSVMRRLGPCEAGQTPGDTILPDGRTIHMPSLTR